jgi:tyrosinase
VSPTVPAAGNRPAGALHNRKSVERLNERQIDDLRAAFAAVKRIADERGFAHHAGIHGLPLPMFCQHGTDVFLPWHRAYLYFFELAVQDQVAQVSLPWWDWTSPASHRNGLPRPYAAARPGGRQNSLYSAAVPASARRRGQPRTTTRDPGNPARLPTRAEIERILETGDFLDFSRQLEDIHGAIHVWVGGTMGVIAWAAYDPIFWAHHAMIDRLWRLWQLRHPGSGPDAALKREALPPFQMTVAQTIDVNALGYEYAATTTHTAAR